MVRLEDPVSKFIPAFSAKKLSVGSRHRKLYREVTLRDLLAHTSGVGFGPGFGYEPENDYEETYTQLVRDVDKGLIHSLAEWCNELAKLPLRFQPGKDWGYGYSSDILGRVVEVASARALDEFLLAEVIAPLDMHDTFFKVPTESASRLAALYKREPWDGNGKHVNLITVDVGGSGLAENVTGTSTSAFLCGGAASKLIQGGGCVCSMAGGLVSSIADYARFGQMLLNEGELAGVRLLQPETVRLLAKDWLNEFTNERRSQPLWVWGSAGIGFSPLGQIGVKHRGAVSRRIAGAALDTVHWGGAGGSGYMLNWPHKVLVLTYTGCTFDTETQKTMWRATFAALHRGGAKHRHLLDYPATARNAKRRGLESTTSAKRRRK